MLHSSDPALVAANDSCLLHMPFPAADSGQGPGESQMLPHMLCNAHRKESWDTDCGKISSSNMSSPSVHDLLGI
jgi:hypothetical protein